MISRVHGHIQRFLKKLALKFLNLDVIDENDNPAKIDFENTNNQKRALMLKRVNRISIHCCHRNPLLSFDTIIHWVLLYLKSLRYLILFSICSDSQLEVDLNARCKINRMFNDGDIIQHQQNKLYSLSGAFYKRAFKYALDNLLRSDELLKHVKVINWEQRK